MIRFRWFRRYQYLLGLLALAAATGVVYGYLAQSALFGGVIFAMIVGILALWEGLRTLGRRLRRRSARTYSLHRWLSAEEGVFLVILMIFTVIGALMAVAGSGSDRLTGIGAVLFFGPVSLFVGVHLVLDRQPSKESNAGEATVRTIRHNGQSRQALVFDFPITGVEVGLATFVFASWTVACILFGLIQSVILVRLVLFGCGVLAGIMTLVGGIVLLSGRSTITFLDTGILVTVAYSTVFVPWDAVEDVEVFAYANQTAFGITVIDRSTIEGSWVLRLSAPINRDLTGHDITCRVTTGPVSEQIETTARHLLTHPGERSSLARIIQPDDLS